MPRVGLLAGFPAFPLLFRLHGHFRAGLLVRFLFLFRLRRLRRRTLPGVDLIPRCVRLQLRITAIDGAVRGMAAEILIKGSRKASPPVFPSFCVPPPPRGGTLTARMASFASVS